MAFLDDLTLGRFYAGQSLMHRLDSRLKLVFVAAMVIAVFSVTQVFDLAVLTLSVLILVGLSAIPLRIWWRGLWIFRWLFLFTLVLHVIFSPGRTLLGTTFLSWDGLLSGLRVLWQLSLAILLASFLTMTVSPARLSNALVDILAPLGKVKVPVVRMGDFFLLILNLLPILQHELASLPERHAGRSAVGFAQRFRGLRETLSQLILRLCDRGEELAQKMVLGEKIFPELKEQDPRPLNPAQNGVLFMAGLGIFVLILLGG